MATTDYNFGERLLHRLALGIPLISKASFEFDNFLPGQPLDHSDEKHVFVSGLARAGTTILMRTFYDTGQFRSLTYRDMPFVLMPGMWKKLSAHFHKDEEAKERAHGDGIAVNFDSPEAFEEVFWRIFSGGEYIFGGCLRPYTVNKELVKQFRVYVQRIVGSAGDHTRRRYLSKNNNNILRLDAIRKAFPTALILIPFRDPIQQAISLLTQHQKFCGRNSIDEFTSDYMRWLGHHEFGATHKPFLFDKEPESSVLQYNTGHVNYWLSIWVRTYRYLLDSAPSGSIFVSYEDLCDAPQETLTCLFESANMELNKDRIKMGFSAPLLKNADGINVNLRNQAQQIYQELRERALARDIKHENQATIRTSKGMQCVSG